MLERRGLEFPPYWVEACLMQRSPSLIVSYIRAVLGESNPGLLAMNQTWGSELPHLL